MRRPKATLPATSMCGNSCSSWKTMPTPRRWVGTDVMSTPSSTTTPAVGHDQAGDHAQQRALAAPGRSEQGDDLAGARPARSHARRAPTRPPNATRDVIDLERGSACVGHRRGRRRRSSSTTIGDRGRGEDRRRARRPGPATAPPVRPSSRSMAIGIVSCPLRVRKLVAPNSPSEIAAASPARHERPAGAGAAASTSATPAAAARRASPPPRAARGRCCAARGSDRAHDERERRRAPGRPARATTRRASRTAAVSNVISMPNPIVTADVRERQHQPGVEQPTVPVGRR